MSQLSIETYREILDRFPDAVLVVNEDGAIQATNEHVTEIFGYEQPSLSGESIARVIPASPQEILTEHRIERLKESDASFDIDSPLQGRHEDGSLFLINVDVRPLQTPDEFHFMVVVGKVSDEKSRALNRMETFLEDIESKATIGAYEVNLETEAVWWTDGMRALFEVEDSFVPTLENSFEFYHPEDRERIIEAYESRVTNRDSNTLEARISTATGNERWIEGFGYTTEINGDRVLRGYVQDITERKRKQRALLQYRTAIENSMDLLSAVDENYEFLFANKRYRAFHDFPAEHDGPIGLEDILGEQQFEYVKPLVDRVYAGENVEYEMTRTVPSGDERVFDIQYFPLTGNGDVEGVVAAMRDVTERKRREEALERSLDLQSTTETLADIGGWEYDLETETVLWTDGARRIYELSETDEPELRDVLEFYHPEDREIVEHGIEKCRVDGKPFDREARLLTVEGQTRWVRMRGHRIEKNEGTFIRGAVRDITNEKLAEQRLKVLNRVFRHNLRNGLNIIIGYAELLEEELEAVPRLQDLGEQRTDEDIAELIAEINSADGSVDAGVSGLSALVERVAAFSVTDAITSAVTIEETTQELLRLAEKVGESEQFFQSNPRSERVDIRGMIEELVGEYKEQFPTASITISGNKPVIETRREVLYNVITELLENALVHSDRDEPTVKIELLEEPSEGITCRIKDDGPGLPEIERDVLEEGTETVLSHGSGIGLWHVHWQITQLGGTVRFEANHPRGSIITIELPETTLEQQTTIIEPEN